MASLLAAYRFLYSCRPGAGQASSANGDVGPARWLHWIVPLGLLVGVGLAMLLGLCWGLLTYRPPGLWAVAVPPMLFYWLGPGSARYAGWGETWAGIRLGGVAAGQAGNGQADTERFGLYCTAVVAAAVGQFVAVAMLPVVRAATIWQLPDVVAFVHDILFPWTHYGTVVLMAAWGNGAVLLASCLGRPAGHADPLVRKLLAYRTWPRLLWGLLGPAAVSMLFIVGWRWQWDWPKALALAAFDTLAIAVIMFGVTTLFAWLLARRVKGQCRRTLLAAGLVGEITFLIVFHAMFK